MRVVAWNVAGTFPRDAVTGYMRTRGVNVLFLAEVPLEHLPSLRCDASYNNFTLSRASNTYYGKTTVVLTRTSLRLDVTWPMDRVARIMAPRLTVYALHAPSLYNGSLERVTARKAWDVAFQRLLGATPAHTVVIGDYNYDFDDARAKSLTTTPLDILACNMTCAEQPAVTFRSPHSGSLHIDMCFHTPDITSQVTYGNWEKGIDHVALVAKLTTVTSRSASSSPTTCAGMPSFAAVRLDYNPTTLQITGIQVRASACAAGNSSTVQGGDTLLTFLTAPLDEVHAPYQRMYRGCEVQPLHRVLPALNALLTGRHVVGDASHHRVWERAFGPAIVAMINWVAIEHTTTVPMALITALWKAGCTIPTHKLRPVFKPATLVLSGASGSVVPPQATPQGSPAQAVPQESPAQQSPPPPSQDAPQDAPQSLSQTQSLSGSPTNSDVVPPPAHRDVDDIAAWCAELYDDLMPMLTAKRDAVAAELHAVQMRRVNAALALFEKRVSEAKAQLDDETRKAHAEFAAACAELPVSKKIARHDAQRSRLPRRAAATTAMARIAAMTINR